MQKWGRGKGGDLGVENVVIYGQSTNLNGPKQLGNQLERKYSRLKMDSRVAMMVVYWHLPFQPIFHKGSK